MKRRILLFFILCLMLSLIPVNHAYAIKIDGQVYDDNDFYKMQSFLNQASATSGRTNAQTLFWDTSDPSTWWGVVWNEASPKRIKEIEFFSVAGDLDVSGLTYLESLRCSFDELNSINASGTESLKTVYCSYSAMESLDVSGASALETVYCTYSQLKSLNVSDASSLTEIYCNNNQLEALDVSGLGKLTYLHCNNNQLESLNVSGTTSLAQLACHNNRIKELEVSQSPALYYLRTGNNRLKLIKAHSVGSQIMVEARGNGHIELLIERDVASAAAMPIDSAAFLGWSGHSAEASSFPLTLGETDYHLTADFSLWNVVFDKNGGDSDAVPSNIGVSHESQLDSWPAPPALSGYSFGGWYKEAECENAWDFDNDSVISDTMLFVKWIEEEKVDTTNPDPTPETSINPASTVTPSPPTKPEPTAIAYIPKEPVPVAETPSKNVLSITPQNGIISVGGRLCLEPNVTGGIWEYDPAYLSDNGGVFTALKAGTTRIAYTDGSQSAYADIVINPAGLPLTGQCFASMWVLLALGLCVGAVSLFAIIEKKGTACLKKQVGE